MVPSQPRWKCLLVERASRPQDVQTVGNLRPIARRAGDLRPDTTRSSGLGEEPPMVAERRLVADVLAMQTRQVGDPFTSVVQTETDDSTQHDLIMLDRTTVGTETRTRIVDQCGTFGPR